VSFAEWLRAQVDAAASEGAAKYAAARLAEWIDGEDVTPARLEAAAAAGEDLIFSQLARLSPQDLAAVRAVAARVGRGFGPRDGRRMLEVLEWSHPAHVAAISRHIAWYDAQVARFLAWARGSAPS
jgi:hypothetical protein